MCAVELFIQMRSITETQRGFCSERNQQEAPSPNAIRRWVRQWCEEGCVTCKKPPARPSSVCTPDNIARVLASVSCSLRRSACEHTQVLCVSDRSVWRILCIDLSLHPYKLQVVHALRNWDREMRLQFCCQFVEILTENPDLPNKLLMSDQAHFHLHGTVNKQSFQYWSAANPHELHQCPTCDPKVTEWCAVWSRGVIGPYFFEDEDGKAITVTSQWYTEMINEFLSPNLPPNNGTLQFQQDGAMAHTIVISIAALRHLFPQRVIPHFGDVPWPPHLPDLTAPDFFLWGYLKSKMYSTFPTDLHALKENIREEIAKFSEETLQAIVRTFVTHVHLCIEEGGGHLTDMIHTK